MARARTIIANAEREAQAVILAAKEAAAAAEAQARARAEAILAGRPLPDFTPVKLPDGQAEAEGGSSKPRVTFLPSDGPGLRYRILGPMSFAAMLQLKREVSRLEGVEAISVMPAEGGDAVLSLVAPDANDVLRKLAALPSLTPRRAHGR
jgi:hypothetical protein